MPCPDQSSGAAAEADVNRHNVRVGEQIVFINQGCLALGGPLGGQVLAPGDYLHIEGISNPHDS